MARDRTTTVVRSSELPLGADQVWEALQLPATMLYVLRGVVGFPSLAGRAEPLACGESGSAWVWLFHAIPFAKWRLTVVEVDPDSRTIATNEGGGLLRRWDHTLHVEATGAHAARYTDTIVIDAGPLTRAVRPIVTGLFAYRHRRWQRLATSGLPRVASSA